MDREQTGNARWRIALICLGLSILALGVLYRESFTSMVQIWWRSETFAHGFLVFPISCYLAWRRRAFLGTLTPTPSLWGILLVLSFGSVWLLARVADVQAIQHACVIAMIPALVVSILGWQVARALAFPLGFLAFAAPIGEWLVPGLMDFTASFAVRALQWTGIPAVLEGRYIHVPGGSWVVSKACSGVRYLIASLALGSLFAYMTYRSPARRLLFFALSAVVPIIANGVRAYGIILLGYMTEGKLATGIDHVIYGWIFFVLVMFLLCWVGLRWTESPAPPVAADPAGVTRGAIGESAAHTSGAQGPPPMRRLGSIGAAGAAIALLSAAPLWVMRLSDERGALIVPAKLCPDAKAPWVGPFDPMDTWRPDYPTADRETHVLYLHGDRGVHLYVAYYGREQQGSELINVTNSLYGGEWRRVSDGARTILVSGKPMRIHETRIRRDDGLRIVWHWYLLSGRSTESPYVAKYLEAEARIRGKHRASALVAVAADQADEVVGDGEALLAEFLETMGAEIAKRLFPAPAG